MCDQDYDLTNVWIIISILVFCGWCYAVVSKAIDFLSSLPKKKESDPMEPVVDQGTLHREGDEMKPVQLNCIVCNIDKPKEAWLFVHAKPTCSTEHALSYSQLIAKT